MAVIWQYKHVNEYGVEIRVDINKATYTGAATTVKGSGRPVSLSYESSDTDKFKPIRPSFLDFELVVEADMDDIFDEVLLSESQDYKVIYYEDSVATWTGYLDASLFERPWNLPPYVVKFRATDGLSFLKYKKFLLLSGSFYEGKQSLRNIVFNCLTKLNLDLGLRIGVNLYEENMTQGDAADPMGQVYVDQERFRDSDGTPMMCWDVLEACLAVFGACLFQCENIWDIVRVVEQDTSYKRRMYDEDGNSDGYDTYDPIVELNPDSDDKSTFLSWIFSPRLQGREPYKEVSVVSNKIVKDSIFQRSFFEGDDVNGNINDWYDGGSAVRGWTYNKRITGQGIEQDEETNYTDGSGIRQFYPLVLKGGIIPVSNDKPKYLSSIISDPIRVWNEELLKLRVTVEFRLKSSKYNFDWSVNENMRYMIKLIDSTDAVWYYTEDYGWTEYDGTYGVDNEFNRLIYNIVEGMNPSIEYTKTHQDFELPDGVVQGYMYLQVFQAQQSEYAMEYVFKQVSLQYLYDGELIRDSDSTGAYLTSESNRKDYKRDLLLFDASDFDSIWYDYVFADAVYGSLYYYDSQYLPTNKWKEIPEGSYTTIQERLKIDIARQHLVGTRMISGIIKGNSLKVKDVLADPNDPNIVYLINRFKEDCRRFEFNVEILEIKRFSEEYLIGLASEGGSSALILDESGNPIVIYR